MKFFQESLFYSHVNCPLSYQFTEISFHSMYFAQFERLPVAFDKIYV